jgi:hypothetical protein
MVTISLNATLFIFHRMFILKAGQHGGDALVIQGSLPIVEWTQDSNPLLA